MSKHCDHAAHIAKVTPSALGCEECLKTASERGHLRLCRICGHVSRCDDSPNRQSDRPRQRVSRNAGRCGVSRPYFSMR
jgi:hypothetical protein